MPDSPFLLSRILLVEDHKIDTLIHTKVLQQLKLAEQIDVSQNGQEAISYLQACTTEGNYPDLILLDIEMPVMNGLQLLARLAASELQFLIPQAVVLLTSSYSNYDLAQVRNYGVRGIITKPLTAEKILSLIS